MGSSVRAGGDVTEAPPPCEACKTYLRSEPSHIALNEWLKMFDEHHRIIAELRAHIVALLGCLASADWDSHEMDEARAALAPKEGK